MWTGYLKPGSIFDPTGSPTAIQPVYYDQWAQLYSRYKVENARIRIRITGGDGNNARQWVAAAYPATDATALTSYQGAASQPYAKTTSGGFQTIQTVQSGSNTFSGVGTEPKQIYFKLNHDSIVGYKSDTWDIGAPIASDPVATQFMVLPMLIQANYAVQVTFVLEVDIWQDVVFSQKKNVVDV